SVSPRGRRSGGVVLPGPHSRCQAQPPDNAPKPPDRTGGSSRCPSVVLGSLRKALRCTKPSLLSIDAVACTTCLGARRGAAAPPSSTCTMSVCKRDSARRGGTRGDGFDFTPRGGCQRCRGGRL